MRSPQQSPRRPEEREGAWGLLQAGQHRVARASAPRGATPQLGRLAEDRPPLSRAKRPSREHSGSQLLSLEPVSLDVPASDLSGGPP
jgi:hypothetical protein